MKISIITVAYNNIEGLKATSQSVLQQTSADIEWIVVDGASKDGSADFLKAFSGADIRWVSERDGGIFDAMNKGIGMASGQYSIFMNAGDIFAEENLIEKVVTAVGDSSPDMIYGDSPGAGRRRIALQGGARSEADFIRDVHASPVHLLPDRCDLRRLRPVLQV